MERKFSIELYFSKNLVTATIAGLLAIFSFQSLSFLVSYIYVLTTSPEIDKGNPFSPLLLLLFIPLLGLLPIYRNIKQKQYFFTHHIELMGKITQSGFIVTPISIFSQIHRWGIVYNYSFNGQQYTGIEYCLPVPKQMNEGGEVVIYVDPERPSRSILPDLYCKQQKS